MPKLMISLMVWFGPLLLCGQNRTEPELVVAESDDQFGAVRWQLDKGYIHELAGNALLRVYTQNPALDSSLPAVLGSYTFTADTLIFQPRFPFLAGRTYWIWYLDQKQKAGKVKTISVEIPERQNRKKPRVIAVYPSTEIWPANQLKFYIHFDQSMRSGFQSEALKIYDDQGQELEDAVLDIAQELWDQEQKRLTVWFDPGRIKSLLIPNQRLGPPLKPHRTYQLVIKKEWLAASGLPLDTDYIKPFRTGERDTQKPDPQSWRISSPRAGTQAPLEIDFFEPMDQAMLQSGLAVLDARENPVKGQLKIGPEESSWSWHPAHPWVSGSYRLRISTDLEDLAGNNLSRLFDAPANEGENRQPSSTFTELLIVIQ